MKNRNRIWMLQITLLLIILLGASPLMQIELLAAKGGSDSYKITLEIAEDISKTYNLKLITQMDAGIELQEDQGFVTEGAEGEEVVSKTFSTQSPSVSSKRTSRTSSRSRASRSKAVDNTKASGSTKAFSVSLLLEEGYKMGAPAASVSVPNGAEIVSCSTDELKLSVTDPDQIPEVVVRFNTDKQVVFAPAGDGNGGFAVSAAGADGNPLESGQYYYGQGITFAAASPEGYEWAGWYSDPRCTEENRLDSGEPTYQINNGTPISVYAKFRKLPPVGMAVDKSSIIGVTDEMEYSVKGEESWKSVGRGDSAIERLSGGTYSVRYEGDKKRTGGVVLGASGAVDVTVKVKPTVDDFTITIPDIDNPYTYNGKGQGINVTPREGVVGMGAVTVFYEGTSTTAYPKSNEAPKDMGTYKATFSVAEGENYLDSEGELPAGDFEIIPKKLAEGSYAAVLPEVKQDGVKRVHHVSLAITSQQIYGGDSLNLLDCWVTYSSIGEAISKATVYTDGEVEFNGTDNNPNYIVEGSKLTKQKYTVNPKAVKALRVETEPRKKEYLYGEIFDPAGMKVIASWDSGDDTDVTKQAKVSLTDPLTVYDTEVKVSYGGQEIHLANIIVNKRDPVIKDFSFDLSDKIYSGKEQGVVIKPAADTAKGMGTITVFYEGVGSTGYKKSTTAPKNAGIYKVTWDVTEGEGYLAKENLTAGNYTIEPKLLTAYNAVLPKVKQDGKKEVEYTWLPISSTGIVRGDELNMGKCSVTYSSIDKPISKEVEYDDAEVQFDGIDNPNYKVQGTSLKSQSYKVVKKVLMSLRVESKPKKTEYLAGETFNTAGMKVMAEWDSGDDTDVTDLVTLSQKGPLKAEDKEMSVSYSGGKVKLVDITVTKRKTTISHFIFDLSEKRYTGVGQGIGTVKAADGVEGVGTVTTYYEGTGTTAYKKSTTAPKDIGTYNVTLDAKEGANYLAELGMEAGSYTILPKILKDYHVVLPFVKQDGNKKESYELLPVKAEGIARGDNVNLTGCKVTYPSIGAAISGETEYKDATVKFDGVDNPNYLVKESALSGQTYTVTEKTLKGMRMEKGPNRTVYFAGETFSIAGMKVIAEWDSGPETDVTKQLAVSLTRPLTVEDKAVEFLYASEVISQKIVVKARSAENIKDVVKELPTPDAYDQLPEEEKKQIKDTVNQIAGVVEGLSKEEQKKVTQEQLQQISDIYNKVNQVTVIKEVSAVEGVSRHVADTDIRIIGAGMAAKSMGGEVKVKIVQEKPKEGELMSFTMTLSVKEKGSEFREVQLVTPIIFAIRLPEDIKGKSLIVKHYGTDGALKEELVPVVKEGEATTLTTSFSTFAFAEKKQSTNPTDPTKQDPTKQDPTKQDPTKSDPSAAANTTTTSAKTGDNTKPVVWGLIMVLALGGIVGIWRYRKRRKE